MIILAIVKSLACSKTVVIALVLPLTAHRSIMYAAKVGRFVPVCEGYQVPAAGQKVIASDHS